MLLASKFPRLVFSSSVGTYRTSNMLPERSMSLVASHVEQTLRLSKTSGDIMAGLVGVAVVDLGELLGVADQQHCRSDAHNGACR